MNTITDEMLQEIIDRIVDVAHPAHAKERMVERGTTEDEVKSTIDQGE